MQSMYLSEMEDDKIAATQKKEIKIKMTFWMQLDGSAETFEDVVFTSSQASICFYV